LTSSTRLGSAAAFVTEPRSWPPTLDDHEPATLVEYGDQLGNRTVFKRLGYLVEALERDRAELVPACRERVSAGISLLDPDGPEDGRRVTRWGLRVNVRVEPEEPS
jgi:predicted transcriptional regulator of viral defense system